MKYFLLSLLILNVAYAEQKFSDLTILNTLKSETIRANDSDGVIVKNSSGNTVAAFGPGTLTTTFGGDVALGSNNLTMTGSIGTTGSRVLKGWFTDLEVTNAIAGSITGTAATVTTNANLTGEATSVGNAVTLTNSAVIGKVLTGYTSGAGTVSATDSILQAIQKLNGNDATNANLTGDITSVGNATTYNGTVPVNRGGTGLTTLTANNVILGNGTSTPTFVAPGTSGNVLTSNGTTWQSTAPSTATRCYTLYSEQQTAGTNGGTASVTFVTRTLTTENYDNCNLGTLSASQFTMASGTYFIRACAPAYATEWHQIRLRNITDGTTVVNGESAYSGTTSVDSQSRSCLDFIFTANGTDAYAIQHVAAVAKATNGWGVRDSTAVGGGERFTTVYLEKL